MVFEPGGLVSFDLQSSESATNHCGEDEEGNGRENTDSLGSLNMVFQILLMGLNSCQCDCMTDGAPVVLEICKRAVVDQPPCPARWKGNRFLTRIWGAKALVLPSADPFLPATLRSVVQIIESPPLFSALQLGQHPDFVLAARATVLISSSNTFLVALTSTCHHD